MEWKKMVAYGTVALMLSLTLFSLPSVSADDLFVPDPMPAPPQDANSSTPPPLPARTRGNWVSVVSDKDDGGINIKRGYVQADSNNLYFRLTSYSPWSSTHGKFYILIWIDADQNPGTGMRINDIGADYKIVCYGHGYHYRYMWSSGSRWVYAGSVAYMDSPNDHTADVGVSWATIGGLSEKDILFAMIDMSAWRGDYAPDSGHATFSLVTDVSVDKEDISISGPIVSSGDATISAEIHNNNPWFPEKDVQVRFYLDRNTHIYHTITIESIPANSTVNISVPWHVPSQEGKHVVRVVVDPTDIIGEDNEDNNVAETSVTVLSSSGGSDVTSSSSDSAMGAESGSTMILFGIVLLLLVAFGAVIAINRFK